MSNLVRTYEFTRDEDEHYTERAVETARVQFPDAAKILVSLVTEDVDTVTVELLVEVVRQVADAIDVPAE